MSLEHLLVPASAQKNKTKQSDKVLKKQKPNQMGVLQKDTEAELPLAKAGKIRVTK